MTSTDEKRLFEQLGRIEQATDMIAQAQTACRDHCEATSGQIVKRLTKLEIGRAANGARRGLMAALANPRVLVAIAIAIAAAFSAGGYRLGSANGAPRPAQLLSTPAVAAALGVPAEIVYDAMYNGGLPPPQTVGGRYIWTAADIARLRRHLAIRPSTAEVP